MSVVAACSSSDSETTTEAFCSVGARAMEGQESISVLDFSPQFFIDADAEFAEMASGSPGSLDADIQALRDGFDLTNETFVEFGQQPSDPAFLDALVERLDTDAMTAARDSINTHLDLNCDAEILRIARAPGGYSFDRSDPVGGVTNIMDAFGTDEATASCIYDAWGDASKVPPEELTEELFNFRICGTSIFELISGDSRFTGRDQP